MHLCHKLFLSILRSWRTILHSYAHVIFISRSELDPTAELTPVKSPSPPPTPKGVEGYGDMLEDEESVEDINAPSGASDVSEEPAATKPEKEAAAPPPEPAPTEAGAE